RPGGRPPGRRAPGPEVGVFPSDGTHGRPAGGFLSADGRPLGRWASSQPAEVSGIRQAWPMR
ncbi:hypothetical protein GA0115261_100161, partial [Streptomyces sp. OspMP-M43]